MVLTYSHSEWFVPSLQDLIAPGKSSSRRCVWHKSRRTPKSNGSQLIKCSCPIAEDDAKRADQLLNDLRIFIHTGAHCLEILGDLSLLVLCKNVHRSSNAETIFNFWAAELKPLSPLREPSRQNLKASLLQPSIHLPVQRSVHPSIPPSLYQIPVTTLLEQLGIIIGQPVKCHERANTSARCGNWIKKRNGERIATISRELAGDWRLSSNVLELLEELSELVMCRRWHQGQANSKLRDWIVIIKSKEASREEPPVDQVTKTPHTPIRQSARYSAIETPETPKSSIWSSPRRSRSPESAATNPSSSLSRGRNTILFTSETRRTIPDRLREQICVSPTPISSRTRSKTKARPNGSSVLTGQGPYFESFSTLRSSLKAAEYVMEKIKNDITSREVASGYVYGFRRPGCDLIKIGTTMATVTERLRQTGSACKFTPNVVFEIATNHAMKVERLVHRQLHRQIRRECLVNGHCNEGRGCSTRHEEWFEGVSDTYAEAVVRSWVRWINLVPYDGKGLLKRAWVSQSKLFNLTAPGDIWMQWTEITLMKEEDDDRAFDAAITTKKVLGLVSSISSQLAIPKPEFPAARIATRPGRVGPIPPHSCVDVFA